MLGVNCFALCLVTVTSSAINIRRPIRNAHKYYEQHPAVSQRSNFVVNGVVTMGPLETIPLSSSCNRRNSNGMCKQDAPRGGNTFLTDLEGTSLGPGFPPKPVGLLVRPNVSREETTSTTTPSENRFLVDDTPPLPPPPLKRRPLPKGRLRHPLPNNVQRQNVTDPIILGPLFYEDVRNPEMTTQTEGNSKEASLNMLNGSGEQNRALFDSFNDLDYPDPKLLSEFKGKWYPKYYGEKRNPELKGKDELRRANPKSGENDENREISMEVNNSGEEKRNYEKSVEEAPVSEEVSAEKTSQDYLNSNDGTNQGISSEGDNSHYSTSDDSYEKEEEPELIFDPDYQENSEENKNPTNEHFSEEENLTNSEEEENLPPDTPPTEEQLYDQPLVNQRPSGPLENNGHNSVSSREESSESDEPIEGEVQHPASGEAVHSDEGSTEYKDYSEENNNVDSPPRLETSEETFHLTVEDETSEESNESAQKPASSESTNKIQPSSVEFVEGDDEDYNSREQHSHENTSEEQYSQEHQSSEGAEKPSNEYEKDENEKPNEDYYDVLDYDNASPASDEYEVFPKPEEEPSEQPEDYKKGPPAPFYYIVGGSEEQKKEPNQDSDDVEGGSKPLEYEDKKLKQSEEMDSSITSDDEHSSGSNDSFGSMEFDSFDFDSEMEPPRVENNVKTTQTPVAVMTSTPPTDVTKCNNNDDKNNGNSENQKIFTKPSGTVKPNTLQPADVISFTQARPVNFELMPTPQTTISTFQPAPISAIGIIKPGGSIIAKVVSPTLHVHSPTATSSTAPREATAITYLKPPSVAQTQTWFLGQARTPRFVDFFSRPI